MLSFVTQIDFVDREKRKMKPEVFCVDKTSATASAIKSAFTQKLDTITDLPTKNTKNKIQHELSANYI